MIQQFREGKRRTGVPAFAVAAGVFFAALFFVAPSFLIAPLAHAAASAQQSQPTTAAAAPARRIGAIKAISATSITLTPDSGADVSLTVQPNTRLLRIAPGEKDLKNATPIQLPDLHVGDRILASGKPSDDNSSLTATTIVVMTQSDLAARHEQELQDWQKRGIDGPATAVDSAGGTITISSRGKNVVIQTSKSTIIRRYAPDSVKFDDAKPGTLSEIHPGDQVRARGDHNPDGTTLTAEEIVSGTFRNIAGTVNSADASSSTMNVHDLLSNKNVTVKISRDSQLHQLPPEMAQRLAARLKRNASASASPSVSAAPNAAHPSPDANASNPESGQHARSGSPDLQQILSHTPTVSLSDLHKGDTVIILSTEGTQNVGTIITLLTGVDPILQAAPNASGASILSPWSLGSGLGGDAGGP
jgi:Domain of unknown function (DUF5666)